MVSKFKTIDWFIAKAKAIYGERFDYSCSVYRGANLDIEIGCPIHGSFHQRPTAHFLGRGCPMCNTRIGLCEFLERTAAVHGTRYSYEAVTEQMLSQGTSSTIIVGCRVHGTFSQMAIKHMNGQGCSKCGRAKRSLSSRNTREHFLTKARQTHGDLYDYSKVEYRTSAEKVEIHCKTHGSFWQLPANHTHVTLKQGCPVCAQNVRLTTAQFIERARQVHGVLYDYSLTSYTSSHNKVIVQCKTHGAYTVSASNHMAGKHCPKCTHRVSKGETKWLDLLGVPPEFRQKTLHMSSGTYYTVDAYDPTTNTVYEFHGDYWHGNPERFDPLELNERAGCTFGELYNRTVAKETTLKNDGYNVVVMWEKDFRES